MPEQEKEKKVEIGLKDLVPYINNWWTYSNLVNKEVWFITRIFWSYFKQEDIRKRIESKELPEWTEWPFDIQKKMAIGTELFLRKDTENKFDPNAVEVLDVNLKFLGFLKADIAREIKDVNNFKVKIYEQYSPEWPLKRNSYGASIVIVNLENLEKLKNNI